ncbi:Uncharacterised protein [Acinetobacter baumannii]|uniref:DUF4123 domain-containing protein n=1 Tax=Acinetobacter baumannii TaxID=470 RepID=UPI000DE5EE9B|nr:DUF4123 domain-containing protein [Acinetobacter baumannii]SSR34812.1 Uncharacterised protein [Acinetobacter baumannii]
MTAKLPLQTFFKTFEPHSFAEVGLNVFALADAAQDDSFLKKFEHLRQKCLLLEASGEEAKAVSPHLLQLPQDFSSQEWQWIQQNIAGTARMTIIVSPLSFNYLFEHLRKFLEVKFEGGLEMFLAFWDPVILATLVGHKENKTLYVDGPVFNAQQIKDLLTPIQSWWYWERLGKLQVIWGINERVEQLPYVQVPLTFTVEQEEMMVEATFPDNLIYYLKLNNEFLISHMTDNELYQFVIKSIPEARAYNLFGTRDILNFICLKLIYKENFLTDKGLNQKLERLKDKKISMDEVMVQLVANAS